MSATKKRPLLPESESRKKQKSLIEEDDLDLLQAGKGVTAGFVKCALCNAKSQKRYAFGRGFVAHLRAIHPEADHVQAVVDSKASRTAPGFDRNGKKAVNYVDNLPTACKFAKAGDLTSLRSLDREAVVNERDKFGANALDWAAGEGHLETVKFLIPLFPLSSYQKEPVKRRDGKSCLHWSVRNGHIEVTTHLLSTLYTVESLYTVTTGDGTTPLHVGCYGGHLHMLKHLYDAYQDESGLLFSHKNNWGCTSEHFACMSKQCTPLLLQFFVNMVHKKNKPQAAHAFFMSLNSEKMTPVHKWLLYLQKARECEKTLMFFDDLLSNLTDSSSVPEPPETVRKFCIERIKKSKLDEEQQRQALRLLDGIRRDEENIV
jgi:hypothetical protein